MYKIAIYSSNSYKPIADEAVTVLDADETLTKYELGVYNIQPKKRDDTEENTNLAGIMTQTGIIRKGFEITSKQFTLYDDEQNNERIHISNLLDNEYIYIANIDYPDNWFEIENAWRIICKLPEEVYTRGIHYIFEVYPLINRPYNLPIILEE